MDSDLNPANEISYTSEWNLIDLLIHSITIAFNNSKRNPLTAAKC